MTYKLTYFSQASHEYFPLIGCSGLSDCISYKSNSLSHDRGRVLLGIISSSAKRY